MTGLPRTGTHTGCTWTDLYSGTWEQSQQASVRLLRDWVGGYLIRPHADLGRSGPVCPFVNPAITHQSLLAAFSEVTTAAPLRALILDALDVYLSARHDAPADAGHLAVVTVLPKIADYRVIDRVHQAMKSEFVSRKLMLGQFYPGCTESGLWNAGFRPLSSPVPMLVVRRMMPTDYPFLLARPEWLHSYLDHFAPELPSRLRDLLTSALADGVCSQAAPEPRLGTAD